jgi:hypothetical protein
MRCAVEGIIRNEIQPRCVPHADSPPDFTAQESGRCTQPFQHFSR